MVTFIRKLVFLSTDQIFHRPGYFQACAEFNDSDPGPTVELAESALRLYAQYETVSDRDTSCNL